MARVSLIIGATIFLVLGAAHGLLALSDLVRPRAFMPTHQSVREAMERSGILLYPKANMWRAWLGFNLSHSMGLVLFGAIVMTVGLFHFALFSESVIVQGGNFVVAAAYFLLSVRFFFWGPTLGVGSALICFLASILLVSQSAA